MRLQCASREACQSLGEVTPIGISALSTRFDFECGVELRRGDSSGDQTRAQDKQRERKGEKESVNFHALRVLYRNLRYGVSANVTL